MDIIRFTSIGVLAIGDSRQVAREKLATPFFTVVKDGVRNEVDAFDDLCLHLYYDDAGGLEFVEAFPPADVTFCGVRFLERGLDAVVSDMRKIGFSPADADEGVHFAEAGIALYAPLGEVLVVAAHRKGYYEDHLHDGQ